MKNFTILGSCVTRDAFNSCIDLYEISNYFARTSIMSLVSKSMIIDEAKINLSSSFQIKCIKHDFEKDFFNIIEHNSTDYLIIDFIDERFNLLKWNESIFTKSNELITSGLSEHYAFLEMERNESLLPVWEESAKLFFNELFNHIPANRVIIHKCFWKSKYVDENGEIREFTNQLNHIERQNKFLNYYYEFIECNFPEMKVIDMRTEEIYCTANHRWGLSPYHFEDQYYSIFLQKLNDIVNILPIINNLEELIEKIKVNSEILFENDSLIHVLQKDRLNITLKDKDLSFAYYVKLNNEVLFSQWYSENRIIKFKPISKGKYDIVIFLRDSLDINNVKYFIKSIKI
ncbi:DUF6270 domain-containing protein [Bacillus sp. JJ664]